MVRGSLSLGILTSEVVMTRRVSTVQGEEVQLQPKVIIQSFEEDRQEQDEEVVKEVDHQQQQPS